MVIAINTRMLSGDTAFSKLLFHYFTRIAAVNAQHHFYFISSEETLPASPLHNVNSIVIRQETANPLLWKLWYNYKLPAVLKKIKAGVLVSAGGIGSLRTKIPQYILVGDLEFLYHPEWYSKRYIGFTRTNMPVSLQKAKTIVALSRTVKNEMEEKFGAEKDKIELASLVNEKRSKVLSWDEKTIIKEKHTGGNEYFLFYGAIHTRSNLTNLLKAFSLFKKRQKSSMQLVLLTDRIPPKNEFVGSLRLYKYRDEVKLMEGLDKSEMTSLIASAWCAIDLAPLYSDINFLQNALFYDVPVIAGNTAQAKELLGEAALYANPSSIDSIAEQLMVIYKDEHKQSGLMEQGKKIHDGQPGDKLWEIIISAGNAG